LATAVAEIETHDNSRNHAIFHPYVTAVTILQSASRYPTTGIRGFEPVTTASTTCGSSGNSLHEYVLASGLNPLCRSDGRYHFFAGRRFQPTTVPSGSSIRALPAGVKTADDLVEFLKSI
jgi:hypothetical protein